jgi:hypothetical protein
MDVLLPAHAANPTPGYQGRKRVATASDGATKLTMIVPGNDEKIVWYRCDKCKTEFRRTVASRSAMPSGLQ